MISNAIRLIADELDDYLESFGLPTGQVILANVADIEQDAEDKLKEHVVLSLVNLEEESALKNIRPIPMTNGAGGLNYEEPPVYFNLYLLFSSTYNQSGDYYERALSRLSLIVQFFQSRKTFNIQNSPNSTIATSNNINNDDKNYLRVFMELYTMTFEQINHLWGSLGGKQVPFVMYKARLVRVKDRRISGTGPIIEEIGTEENLVPN